MSRRSLPLGILATSILLACVACSAGESPTTTDNAPRSTPTGAASTPADDGTQPADDGQGDSSGTSAALCNDLEGADLDGDSDEDMAAGLTLWHQMVTDAPPDIEGSVQKVSEGLDKVVAGDASVAQSDAWAQAIGQVSTWEIANCQG